MRTRLKVARELRAVDIHEIGLADCSRGTRAHVAELRLVIDYETLRNPFVELRHHHHRGMHTQSLFPLLLKVKSLRGLFAHAVFIDSRLFPPW